MTENTINMEAGVEAGEVCNRDGCQGIIEEKDLDGGCSCHLHAPCGYCETPKEFCPECDWDAKDEMDEYIENYSKSITPEQKAAYAKDAEEYRKNRQEFYRKYNSTEPVDKLTWRHESHTHFSMKKIGMFPVGMDIKELIGEIRGTFGGRFERLNEKTGRFSYIAYTD